jgi:hypothetical protein
MRVLIQAHPRAWVLARVRATRSDRAQVSHRVARASLIGTETSLIRRSASLLAAQNSLFKQAGNLPFKPQRSQAFWSEVWLLDGSIVQYSLYFPS